MTFRGALFGFLLLTGINPSAANAIQAIVYALATRLGAPGRNRYMLAMALLDRARRRLGDGRDGRGRGRVPRPRGDAVRGLPVHGPRRPVPAARPRGRGDRQAASDPGRLAGHRTAGVGAARPVNVAAGARGRRPSDARRGARRSRSTSTSRSASRSVRTATSSSTPGPRRAGRATGSRRSSRRSATELRAARRRPRRALRAPPGRRSRRVYLGGGTPSLLPADAIAELVDLVRQRFGLAAGRRGHARGEPRAGRARRRGGAGRRRRHADLVRRPEPRRGGAPPARPAASAGRRRRRGRRGARGRDRFGQRRSALRRPGRLDRDLGGDARGDPAPGAGPPLALRPDPRRPRCRGPDRPGRRPPADDDAAPDAGGRRARADQDDDRAAEPVRPRRRPAGRRRLARLRDQNWSRPGHESRHNLAYWDRRPYEAVGPGRARVRRRDRRWNAARLDGYLAALAPAGRRASRACRRAARRRSTRRRRRRRRSSSGCGRTGACRASAAAAARRSRDALAWGAANGLDRDRPTTAGSSLTTRGRLLSNELFARLL